MEKILASAFLLLTPLVLGVVEYQSISVSGYQSAEVDYLSPAADPTTASRFSEREITITNPLPFEIKYVDDPESEYGSETIQQEGQKGELIEIFKLTFWDGKEVGRRLVSTERGEPIPQVVQRGTKIVWRTLGTEDLGRLNYWGKLSAFATSYDGNCLGCRGLTRSGTPVRHGVCAVDPKLIPLGTNFYVPGYGICRAEDTGGAIKGKRIDLGFEDVRYGNWSARYTDVYLLTRP